MVGASPRWPLPNRLCKMSTKSLTPITIQTVSLPGGAEPPVVLPSLNWPFSFLPQHRTPPVVIYTQVYEIQSTDVLRTSGGRPPRVASSQGAGQARVSGSPASKPCDMVHLYGAWRWTRSLPWDLCEWNSATMAIPALVRATRGVSALVC